MERILIVDDSPTALMWQQILLRLEGYDILTAMDGVEGVRVARRERPDLIVLDVSMPKMDGFEACRALRAAPETMATPILIATTHGGVDNVLAGYEAGCNAFLTKPLERSEYLMTIRSHVNRYFCGAA